ncbi:thioredoxin-like protein [Cutaneotrichosporon oleaginosum]|uniref:Thioredoxin-like protein n=1 Tax=Cutaneotrichosporon oleaginosum TaxID=879819 RepID=A0A0J0XHJ4_9TREE|nr:thioredoxin-like protein [Cutaneotrichosporon oleaginosum]KLT40482.1 thioredoxin-like protein [Cutaneotrichosporon oleaginosum]TXT15328.1 hypothetical protein COLE_01521 [Cutaneotrichosporon oleaginosum]
MSKLARTLKVDITSDTVCPFCLLGITQFEAAIAKWNKTHPDNKIKLDARLLPYQLRPQMSEEPQDLGAWSAANFGGPERAKAMRTRLAEAYKQAGLELAPSAKVANTNAAHRLETLADTKGRAVNYAVGKDIMRAYQLHGTAPNDPAMLAKIGTQHGLFETEAQGKEWLASDALNKETQRGYLNARADGITGVPFFVFDDKYASSGAVGEDAFYNVIEQVVSP